MNGETFNYGPRKTCSLDGVLALIDLFFGPDLANRDVMQGGDDTGAALLVGYSERLTGSLGPNQRIVSSIFICSMFNVQCSRLLPLRPYTRSVRILQLFVIGKRFVTDVDAVGDWSFGKSLKVQDAGVMPELGFMYLPVEQH